MERDVQHRSFRTSSRTNAVLAAGKGDVYKRQDQKIPVMFVHDGIRVLSEDTKKAADPYGPTAFFAIS